MQIATRLLSRLMLVSFPILCSALAIGQEKQGGNGGNGVKLLTVESNPRGAIVKIEGTYSFVGRTPYIVPYPLTGKYKIRASKHGYESETSQVYFVPNEESKLFIKLTPKTRLRAGVRSAFFPGWGQFYGGNKKRAFLISTAEIALAARTVIAFNDYNSSQDALDTATEEFLRTMSETSFENVQKKLAQANKDDDFRKVMLRITAGVWIYNILDSIIFFPKSPHIEIKTEQSSLISMDNQMMFSWKISF